MKSNTPALLVVESDSLVRTPQAKITIEDWLPRWTRYNEVLTSENSRYGLGHTAVQVPQGDGTHYFFRFRSGSAASPANGTLYKCVITDLEDPSSWGNWVTSTIIGVMRPAWTAPGGSKMGAGMDCCFDPLTGHVHLYYFMSDGDLWMAEFDIDGTLLDNNEIADLGTDDYSMAHKQVACVRGDECFIGHFEEVEASYAAWHKPIYGTSIKHYYYAGGWQLDDSFFSQQTTHLYGGLGKDGPDYDAPNTGFQTQWGPRVTGGLAANTIDDDTVAISFGAIYYHRYGVDTHSQAIFTYLYHRSAAIWELVTEAGTSDYQTDEGLEIDMSAKASSLWLDPTELGVDASQLVVWSRLVEPIDQVQVQGLGIPRPREVVYALFRDDGRQLSDFQYLGHQDYWNGAKIVNGRSRSPGPQILAAFGYEAWAVADAASWLYPADLSLVYPEETNIYSAGNWYDGGGIISASKIQGAYQAIGAADLAASLINLFNPGVNDLTSPGNAPDHSPITGWTFDKTNSEYLQVTGIGPRDDTTIIIRYKHDIDETFAHVIGSLDGTNWWFIEAGGSDQTIYRARDEVFTDDPTTHPWGTTKVGALVSLDDGKNYAYLDGVQLGLIGDIGSGYTPSYDFFVGAANNNGSPSNHSSTTVEAFAIYRGELSEEEVIAVMTAMNEGFLIDTSTIVRQEYEEVEIFNEFEFGQDNRWRSTLSLATSHAGGLFNGEVQKAERGNLVRAYLGNTSELVQTAWGFIDSIDPTVQAGAGHGAQVRARPDKSLQDIRAEAVVDLLPQATEFIPPNYPISQFERHQGKWTWGKIHWSSTFFAGQYASLDGRGCYRLQSSPEAATGGALADPDDPASGGGGKIWDSRPDWIGSWWNDVSWVAFPTMVDGSIETTCRFGDDKYQTEFNFLATTGVRVYATPNRTNGLITSVDWRTKGYTGPIWNNVAQEACMAGVICHAVDIGRKYAFVWESNSDFVVSSHTDDTWKAEDFDTVDFAGRTVGANRLYLVVSDYDTSNEDWRDDGDWIHIAVEDCDATGLTPGKPAQLKMVVAAGTIYCFYRNFVNSPTSQEPWRFAFAHRAGHFGAGKFGLIGRGHSGIQWDYLYPGRHYITRLDNYVDFWDVKVTDGVIDKTMEDNLRYIAWNCRQATEFKHKTDEIVTSPPAAYPLNDAIYGGLLETTNPVIDLELTPSVAGGAGEWGIAIRADNSASPASGSCFVLALALDVDNDLSVSSVVKGKFILRRYQSGSLVREDYQPIWLSRAFIGNKLPIRFSALEDIFTCWIAGRYIGHFLDDTELFGEYLTLVSGVTTDLVVGITFQELYEVPQYAIIDINQPMSQAMQKLIAKRRLKGFFRSYSDQLFISYFLISEAGPTFQNVLTQSNYRLNDRFASIVNVQGACNQATYANPTLLQSGRRYMSVSVPEITEIEHLYLEAKAILKEIWEMTRTINLTGLYDFRVEPEDKIGVIITWQGVNNYFIIDNIITHFAIGSIDGQRPVLQMGIGVRQYIDYATMGLPEEGVVDVQDTGPTPVDVVGDPLTYARWYGVWMDTYFTHGGIDGEDDPDINELRFYGR